MANPYVKQYLMTAGPTPLPPAVSQVMAEPMLYHRAPAFVEIYERVLGKLPGVGPKTAARLAFHILRAPAEDALALASAISAVASSMINVDGDRRRLTFDVSTRFVRDLSPAPAYRPVRRQSCVTVGSRILTTRG